MTDEETHRYLTVHGREGDYKKLAPDDGAYYDGIVDIDLSQIEPMIALPSHPSNAFALSEFIDNAGDILHGMELDMLLNKVKAGAVYADQGVIAGCAGGTFDNLCAAADIIGDRRHRNRSVCHVGISGKPARVYCVNRQRCNYKIAFPSGVTVRSAFCGPCFGAGDVPSNGAFSIRHTTRNFPNREGSKPGNGQSAYVALMDARSIAATAANGRKAYISTWS